MQPIAFLGLGAIGAPMATHLAPPATALTVWNRSGARSAEFGSRTGARVASTPADAARGAEVVITCLPTSREVAGLLDGPDGLLNGMATGTVLVDVPAPVLDLVSQKFREAHRALGAEADHVEAVKYFEQTAGVSRE